MIFRVDEDRVIGTSSHAGFATNTDRLIEIDDAVGALEHGGGGTGSNTRCVRALIAARHLMRPARLGENSDVDMFYVSARD